MEKRKIRIITVILLLSSAIITSLLISNINITGLTIKHPGFNLYIIEEQDSLILTIPIKNENNNSQKVNVEITILNSKNKEIKNLKSPQKIIESNKTDEIKAKLNPKLSPGKYQARIFLFIGNQSYSFSKNFEIEQKTLSFKSINIKEFNLGEKANISIIIENHLNQTAQDVSSGILIYKESGEILSELKTKTYNINKKELKKMNLFWDTTNLKPGKYNAKLIINHQEEIIDKEIVINLQEDNIEIIGIGYSIIYDTRTNLRDFLPAILIILIILINLAWIIFYTKTKLKTR